MAVPLSWRVLPFSSRAFQSYFPPTIIDYPDTCLCPCPGRFHQHAVSLLTVVIISGSLLVMWAQHQQHDSGVRGHPSGRARAGTHSAVISSNSFQPLSNVSATSRLHPPPLGTYNWDNRALNLSGPASVSSGADHPHLPSLLPSLHHLLPAQSDLSLPSLVPASGPHRTRGQRRSTIGTDFHRPPYLRPVHEHYLPSAHHGLPTTGHGLAPYAQHYSTTARTSAPYGPPYYRSDLQSPNGSSPPSSGQTGSMTLSMPHTRSGTPTPPSTPPALGPPAPTPGRTTSSVGPMLVWPNNAPNELQTHSQPQIPNPAPAISSSAAQGRGGLEQPQTKAGTSSATGSAHSAPSSRPPSSTGTSVHPSTSSRGTSIETKPADRRRRRKVPFSYSNLIAQAISSAPEGKMTLREIYAWINWVYPNLYPLDAPQVHGWQNTVRHNLSLNKMFVKVPRTATDPHHGSNGGWGSVTFPRGKGGYWTLDTSVTGACQANGTTQDQGGSGSQKVQRSQGPTSGVSTTTTVPQENVPTSSLRTADSGLDARFQRVVALNDRGSSFPSKNPPPPAAEPFSKKPTSTLDTVGETSSGYTPAMSLGPSGTVVGTVTVPSSHGTAPPAIVAAPTMAAPTGGRRRAATFNPSVEPDYAYAYAYNAPYGSLRPWNHGAGRSARARGFTTTATDKLPPFAPPVSIYRSTSPRSQAQPISQDSTPVQEDVNRSSMPSTPCVGSWHDGTTGAGSAEDIQEDQQQSSVGTVLPPSFTPGVPSSNTKDIPPPHDSRMSINGLLND